MENIRTAVEVYLQSYPPAYQMFKLFTQVGDVYLIGGILREYRDKGLIGELRDADFIVHVKDLSKWINLLEIYQPVKNHFGGYKFFCSGFFMDVWKVEETWAYREGKIKFEQNNYLHTLPETVFLNLDSIIYDLKQDKWYDSIYQSANETGILDVVLEDNPFVGLNILRAMILKRKYQMTYSEKLKKIILKYCKEEVLILKQS